MTTASVVICTYNRVESLRQAIDSLNLQRFREFEVVVVNGPSTDGTADYLHQLEGVVKCLSNSVANLSISRNIGIRESAGEFVAFIDDDAIPEPAWLEQILPVFDDPEVAGVGGLVLDHTGMTPQYVFSASNRFAETTFASGVSFDKFCFPGSQTFPYLQGTNAVFRRQALGSIGLFDEQFDFYLDETDVCCRLVDAGFVLRQLASAPVHHKVLESSRRNEARVVTNWFSVMRNHVYFGFRHTLKPDLEPAVLEHAAQFQHSIFTDASFHEERGEVDAGHSVRARAECERAIEEGVRLGRQRANVRIGPEQLKDGELLLFGKERESAVMRIAFLTDAVAEATLASLQATAAELARRGHEVRVLGISEGESQVDLVGAVWVHRLGPGSIGSAPTGSSLDQSCAVLGAELTRISSWWEPDVVIAPSMFVGNERIVTKTGVAFIPVVGGFPEAAQAALSSLFDADAQER